MTLIIISIEFIIIRIFIESILRISINSIIIRISVECIIIRNITKMTLKVTNSHLDPPPNTDWQRMSICWASKPTSLPDKMVCRKPNTQIR